MHRLLASRAALWGCDGSAGGVRADWTSVERRPTSQRTSTVSRSSLESVHPGLARVHRSGSVFGEECHWHAENDAAEGWNRNVREHIIKDDPGINSVPSRLMTPGQQVRLTSPIHHI